MTPLLPTPYLHNQSLVRFTSGSYASVAYSNTVSIPRYGPAIAIRKETDAARATLGQTIAYRIRISNTGNAAADITLFDPCPPGTSLVPNTVLRDGAPLPGADPAAGVALGSLAPGGEADVSFQLILTAIPASLAISNMARAVFAFTTPEGRRAGGEASSNEVAIPVSDVSLSAALRTRWSQTFAGDIVHYEVRVENEGAQAVADTAVDLNLPSGLAFLAGSVTIGDIRSPGASPVGGIPVGGIPAGGSVSVAFDAQVGDLPSGTILTCEAVVRYTVGGEQFAATTNAVSIVVVKPEVALTLSASPVVAAPGDTIAYALVAYNASDFAVEATLTGYLPAGLAPAGGIVVIDGRQVAVAAADSSIPLGIIGPGARVYISFKAVAPSIAGGTAPSVYTNEARLVYAFRLNDGRAVGSSVLSNSVSVRIVAPAIHVVVSADPSYVYPGEEFRIRAEVSNTGNAAADTILTNLLPIGARFAGYSVHVDGVPTAIVLDGSVALGLLKPGERRRIEYRLIVPEHTDEEVIDGVLNARYRFEVAGTPHAGESRSNAYQVSILSQDE